jgi:polysaccharide export outer membrane protein
VGTVGGLLLLCVAYCLAAPNQYEASARVALRMQPASSLTVDGTEAVAQASVLGTPLQLETLVNRLRAQELSWSVLTGLRLYEQAAFVRNFHKRFPAFDPRKPGPEAEEYLLKAFQKRLHVRALPRTLLVEVRFRCRDASLAAAVTNELVRRFMEQEVDARREATGRDSIFIQAQLDGLTAEISAKERKLADFERLHGFMSTQQSEPGGVPVETLHDPVTQPMEEAGRLLAGAIGDRILRESLYQQAQAGSPEQVLAANPELQAQMGPAGAALAQQLHAQLSSLALERAQLMVEHGPKYARVLELDRAQAELEGQIRAEDANMLEAFRRTFEAAADREKLLRRQLESQVALGVQQNQSVMQYQQMREELVAEHLLSSRLRQRVQEAGLTAGIHAASIVIVDEARVPFTPVAPDPALYLSITLVAGIWIALVGALVLDRMGPGVAAGKVAGVVLMLLLASGAYGQAPTPNTSGLPSGVVKLPQEPPVGNSPNPKTAPPVWNAVPEGNARALSEAGTRAPEAQMALPIAAGDFVDVSEFHAPEMRSTLRVAADGAVELPLAGRVNLLGMSEEAAAKAIEAALVAQGQLLHPQVTVLVTNAVGQDVSVLGEVTRPGVYSYTVHHRLLDLLSAASGLGPNAGRLVVVTHRDDPAKAHPYVLDLPGKTGVNLPAVRTRGANAPGMEIPAEHNPELLPGDTVEVSRAGLVYVIGDVVRPGGFAVDPVQGLTVVQALSLAWGATPNAAASKAILIRDQAGGRTLTTLNLRRMIRGQDPDQPVLDRDILFLPDSTAKSLMNKSLESAIQSAIGVSIYAGLVYSQRF